MPRTAWRPPWAASANAHCWAPSSSCSDTTRSAAPPELRSSTRNSSRSRDSYPSDAGFGQSRASPAPTLPHSLGRGVRVRRGATSSNESAPASSPEVHTLQTLQTLRIPLAVPGTYPACQRAVDHVLERKGLTSEAGENYSSSYELFGYR